MRIVERRNGLVGLLVGLALFCVALPASAQDARLKLDHLEKLSAKENNEIYVMKDAHNNIAGIAILVAEPKELTVVNIVGPVDLDKLSALGGKFGIPENKEKEHPKKRTSPEASHDNS